MNAADPDILAEPDGTVRTGKVQPVRDRDIEPLVRQVVETLEEDIVFGYLHPR